MLAEVKGKTSAGRGKGIDAAYGQLLRRMPADELGHAKSRFAIVVPDSSADAAKRVPKRIRDALRIDLFTVSDDGTVERLID